LLHQLQNSTLINEITVLQLIDLSCVKHTSEIQSSLTNHQSELQMSLQILTAAIGAHFHLARNEKESIEVTLTALNERLGKVGDEKLPYCQLTADGFITSVHPKVMLKVLSTGADSGIKKIDLTGLEFYQVVKAAEPEEVVSDFGDMVKPSEVTAFVAPVVEAAPVEQISTALVVAGEVIEIADEVVGDVVTSTKDNSDVTDISVKECAPEAVVMTGWAASLNNMTSAPSNPVTSGPKQAAEKPASKKAIAGRVYLAGVAKGDRRKVIIADMMAAAGLSDNGAGTYYQNFKSGQWAAA
jgi:hypothetical protein